MTKPLIPSDALEGLMTKVFFERTVETGLFWDALIKANLYIPLQKGTNAESLSSQGEPNDVPLLLGQNPEGEDVIWIFTSPAVMVEYTEQDLPCLEVAAPALFTSLQKKEHEVVLIGPEGLTLSLHPELMDSLAQGRVPEFQEESVREVPKDLKFRVGPPTDPIEKLAEILVPVFSKLDRIREASFIQIADDVESRLLLGLVMTDESRDHLKEMAQIIAKVVEGTLEKGKRMDVTYVSGSLKEAFAKYGHVFYKK